MMNQREAIAKFIDQNRPKFNQTFFTRDEDAIIRELMNVIYSCERDNQYFTIKVDSFRVVDDYDEINEFLKKNNITKVELIYQGYEALKQMINKK